MRISYTFRNMEPSEGIKNYASEKISKLQKYCRAPVRHLHRTDISVTADSHQYTSHEQSEDMYASIDLVTDKILRQLRDRKSTETDRMRHGR